MKIGLKNTVSSLQGDLVAVVTGSCVVDGLYPRVVHRVKMQTFDCAHQLFPSVHLLKVKDIGI